MTWRFLRSRRTRLAAVTLCVIPLAAFLLAWWLCPRCLEVSQPPEKADAIVVLSGDDEPRLNRAADLFDAGYAPIILFSGFDKEELDRFLAKRPIPESARIVEPTAKTTYANATHSAPLLRKSGARTVLLVTSWFHSRRALQTFRHVMPDMRFVSVPTRHSGGKQERQRANVEFWKLCYYGLVHRVSPF